MKTRNSVIVLLTILSALSIGAGSCVAPHPAPSASPDVTMPVFTPAPVTTPAPGVTPTATHSPAVTSVWPDILTINEIVSASSCRDYKWKDRGRAPGGYVKGLAYVFAQKVCGGVPPLGDESRDALKWFEKPATLVNTYTLLLGLGMRESSGKYAEGWDKSGTHAKSDEYEAGLFQFSYNSIGASGSLRPLYAHYQAHPELCLLPVFMEGATDPHRSVGGTGDAAVFQAFTKECPAFATEYAAILIRVLRKHFGPVNRKEAEFRDDCAEMFQKIQNAVKCP